MALAPAGSDSKPAQRRRAQDLREAELHVAACSYCSEKVSKYRQLVNRSSDVVVSEAVLPGLTCPDYSDVDWPEVAAGLWPEFKSQQLIMHAALCDHCGPLLRAALSVDDDPTPEEEIILQQVTGPARPPVQLRSESLPVKPSFPTARRRHRLWKILIPALAALVIAGIFALKAPSLKGPLSGSDFAEFAVETHRQYARGTLPLAMRSDSQQTVNNWLKASLPFSLALPASPPAPGEERPFRLEGARTVPVVGKTAAYVAYQMQTGPVTLMVAPDSAAVASGGVEANFKKVSFHYRMVEGYKVVTWSQHGLTYAQVSEEGSSTQRSCMTCHSAMRDRDLSQTPTPLGDSRSAARYLQQ